jgi:hypothetical protein
MPTGVRRWKKASENRLDQMTFLVELAGDPDILKAVHALDALVDESTSLRSAAVQEARLQGASWEEIGTALGMSRQAAWERFRSLTTNRAVPASASRNGAA